MKDLLCSHAVRAISSVLMTPIALSPSLIGVFLYGISTLDDKPSAK